MVRVKSAGEAKLAAQYLGPHAKTGLSNFINYFLFLNEQDANTEVCEQLFSWLSKLSKAHESVEVLVPHVILTG